MKRVFGKIEIIFDISYLLCALMIGFYLLLQSTGSRVLFICSSMVFVLAFGDIFHLIPRIKVIITKNADDMLNALGRGKQITSITMSLFYLMFWYLGLLLFEINLLFFSIIIVGLTVTRIIICILPQNKWNNGHPSFKWGVIRNVPFILEGIMVMILFYINRDIISSLQYIYLAIIISFIFYVPVVLWANKIPKIGMLMLPKTMAYIWIIITFTTL